MYSFFRCTLPSGCKLSLLSADFENQGAHRLAKDNDPDGRRTIGEPFILSTHFEHNVLILSNSGVLTKPDRIPQGEEDRWLRFIRNEREPLENNWYCVKQPASNTLKQGITWMEARSEENAFFSTTRPWSDLDSMHQRYLRTSNLTERLSSILSDLISKRLVATHLSSYNMFLIYLNT